MDMEAKCRVIVAGFILWMVHGRLRFGDAVRVQKEPVLDVVEGAGYVETAAEFGRYKTGYGKKKVGKLLPLVAIATGVSGLPWADAWLQLRQQCGLDAEADQCIGGLRNPALFVSKSFFEIQLIHCQ